MIKQGIRSPQAVTAWAVGVAMGLLYGDASAQGPCKLVDDLNQVVVPVSSSPEPNLPYSPYRKAQTGFVKADNYWFFTAETEATGRELWRTDGTTAGTLMLKDIEVGAEDSGVTCITSIGSVIVFTARQGDKRELWASDGTAVGTKMIKEIGAGLAYGSQPDRFVRMGNRAYFRAQSSSYGSELWGTNGTTNGTKLVKDIATGSTGSNPSNMTVDSAGTTLFFAADDGTNGVELWRTRGGANSTRMLADIAAGGSDSNPQYFVNHGGKTLFAATGSSGRELYSTNGIQTTLVADIWSGPSSSSPVLRYEAVLGGYLFFSADIGGLGSELWRTDGTMQGTSLVIDIRRGSGDSNPTEMLVAGGLLYFSARDDASGVEPWISDGTAPGTKMLRDISASGNSYPEEFMELGNKVLFTAKNGSTRELWTTRGTTSSTVALTGAIDARTLTKMSTSRVLFAAEDSAVGDELWSTNGRAAGTGLLIDVVPGLPTDSSDPESFHQLGSTLLFDCDDGVHGSELWKLDSKGPSLLRDIRPGSGNSGPRSFTNINVNGKTYALFVASGLEGIELWITDGTTQGTTLFYDIAPGPNGSDPGRFVAINGKVFFSANDRMNGIEMWVTDGTRSGTRMLEVEPGPGSSITTTASVEFNGQLYFAATRTGLGNELWVTDGVGVWLADDVERGAEGSFPHDLTVFNGKLYFAATTATSGDELWATSGLGINRGQLVMDIWPGTRDGRPSGFTVCGNRLVFAARDTFDSHDLWETDGTLAGTQQLIEVDPQGASWPQHLNWTGSSLFFTAETASTGRELYVSDLTQIGTELVKDIYVGSDGSSPADLQLLDGGVYFNADDGSRGRELWFSDGSKAGTVLVCDVDSGATNGVPHSSSPSSLIEIGSALYFSAEHTDTGRELYVLSGQALATTVGTGCTAMKPTLSSTSPVIGSTVTISGKNSIPGTVSITLMGLPAAQRYTFPTVMGSGCYLYFATALPPITVYQAKSASWSTGLGIANSPNLIGGEFMLQTLYAGGRLPIYASNGLRWTIGR